jgi:hypothetical protein
MTVACHQGRTEMKLMNKRIVGAAAVVAGLAIVGGAIVANNNSDDSADKAPASPAGESAQVSTPRPDGACTMDVTGMLFTLDPVIAQQFAAGGLNFRTISPGARISEGLATSPRIHTARDVKCDLTDGYIGMRGGFAIENSQGGNVEFRRFRLKLDEGEMDAFLKSTGSSGFEAIDIDASQAQFTERGSVITGTVPMVLDGGAAVAMNATLGTDLPAGALELGTVTITGTTATAQAQAE